MSWTRTTENVAIYNEGYRAGANETFDRMRLAREAFDAITRIRNLIGRSSLMTRDQLVSALMGVLDSTDAGCFGTKPATKTPEGQDEQSPSVVPPQPVGAGLEPLADRSPVSAPYGATPSAREIADALLDAVEACADPLVGNGVRTVALNTVERCIKDIVALARTASAREQR